MTAQWYALQSKPMKESFLYEQLRLREIECYYPHLRVRPVNPRARKVRAYFPGYVFGHLDLEEMSPSTLQWIPGAVGIVSFDGIPAFVPESLVNAIRRHLDEINAAGGEHMAGLKPGEAVVIQGGPFEGYEAILDARLPGSERVRVLLKLLQWQMNVEEISSRRQPQPGSLTQRVTRSTCCWHVSFNSCHWAPWRSARI